MLGVVLSVRDIEMFEIGFLFLGSLELGDGGGGSCINKLLEVEW